MEAKLVVELPEGDGWWFEPKWDGFRCLARKSAKGVELQGKSGKSLNRYFPDIVELIRQIRTKDFVIDGELLIAVDGANSFDTLQSRLHPAASRVERLSQQQPARFIAFDCLRKGSVDLLSAPLAKRRQSLEVLLAHAPKRVVLSPVTEDRRKARAWLKRSGKALDGVIAKRVDGPYTPGERTMLKIKHRRTADCVVGGFRLDADGKSIGSLLLGLFNRDGKLDHVGFTSAFSREEKAALKLKLAPYAGGAGFTGKAPGQSRWSSETRPWTPLKHRLVVEVEFDQVTDGRMRHGARLIRWRPDKKPNQCTSAQLDPPSTPAEISTLMRSK